MHDRYEGSVLSSSEQSGLVILLMRKLKKKIAKKKNHMKLRCFILTCHAISC